MLKGLRVINIAIKKVILSKDCVIVYKITYKEKEKTYICEEYSVNKGQVQLISNYYMGSLSEVKNTLSDICSHYGALDMIKYNDTKLLKNVIVNKSMKFF